MHSSFLVKKIQNGVWTPTFLIALPWIQKPPLVREKTTPNHRASERDGKLKNFLSRKFIPVLEWKIDLFIQTLRRVLLHVLII